MNIPEVMKGPRRTSIHASIRADARGDRLVFDIFPWRCYGPVSAGLDYALRDAIYGYVRVPSVTRRRSFEDEGRGAAGCPVGRGEGVNMIFQKSLKGKTATSQMEEVGSAGFEPATFAV